MSKKILIEIVSDTEAKAKGLPIDVDIRWRPFYLDPTMPKGDGVDKMQRYISKFGEARVAQMLPYMKAVGAKEGINFDYGGRTGHTGDSHRIAELAFEKGGAPLQDKVMEEMFHEYFEMKGNITSHDVLARAAAKAGMCTEAEAKEFLASDRLKDTVERDIKAFQMKYRISGVPFFILNGKYGVSGAQESEAFLEVFEELAGGQA